MIKKVAVGGLRVGAYIEKIDQSWFSTPFVRHRFKITSQKQIQMLKDHGIEEVSIDTQKGIDPSAYQKKVEYIRIPVDHFIVNTILPFELYLLKGTEHHLYLEKNLPFHSEVQHDLDADEIKDVYIPASAKAALLQYEEDTEEERERSKKELSAGFESRKKVKDYLHYLQNFIPVNAQIFSPGLKIPFDLYLEQNRSLSPIVKAESPIPENDFFSNGEDTTSQKNILISKHDVSAYKQFLEMLASKKMTGYNDVTSRSHTAIVLENSKLVAKDLLDNPRSGATVKASKQAVNELINNVLNNKSSFYGLMKINSYDYYTYVHSLNVCTLSIALGIALGLNKKDLFDLSMGGMLHDVGKSKVPASLINKPGKLTDQEFTEVKNHVTRGYLILKEHKELPKRVFSPLLQHHEKLNGKGYPNKLEGDQIDLFGRISSIIDIYDALTTKRAYKKAFTPFDALTFLGKHKEAYDQVVFKTFVDMIGKQIVS
ncbi:MAG: HD-GYP domain-containing protein, partial [Nitrospiria bacterium]